MQNKIQEAHNIFEDAKARYHPQATMILYSGGNDSTALLSLFMNKIRIAAHCNTGTGVRQTREFVGAMSEKYNFQLVEESPGKNDSYESIVRSHGFPGPAQHATVYRRLKERALRKVKRLFPIERGRKYLFLTGIRAAESVKRAGYNRVEKVDGNIVWLNPHISLDGLRH